MKNYGQVGTYVGATGPIGLPAPKRRKHRASKPRHVCATCDLPLVRPGAFHICLDLTKPEPVVVKVKPKLKINSKPRPARGDLDPDELKRRRQRDREYKAKLKADEKRTYPTSHCACGVVISRAAKKCSKCMGLAKRKLTDAQEADIAAAYVAGGTALGLARQYGVTDTVIKLALDRQGVKTRGQGGRPRKDVA